MLLHIELLSAALRFVQAEMVIILCLRSACSLAVGYIQHLHSGAINAHAIEFLSTSSPADLKLRLRLSLSARFYAVQAEILFVHRVELPEVQRVAEAWGGRAGCCGGVRRDGVCYCFWLF